MKNLLVGFIGALVIWMIPIFVVLIDVRSNRRRFDV
jgi:hypothetical protein